MAGEGDQVEVLDPPAPVEGEQLPGGETPPGDTEAEDDSVVITIGEAEPPAEEDDKAAPAWVKELRKTNKEQARKLRELEQAAAERQKAEAPATLKKPSMADPDIDYDTDKYEERFAAWNTQQAAQAEAQRKQQEAQKAHDDAWVARLDGYGKAKTELKVPDFEDAETAAASVLSQTQAAIIVSGADNAAQVVYALGKNPEEAKKLAAITDPVKFAFAVAKLETKLKVAPRKPAPPAPERKLGGTSGVSGSPDQNLDKLRAESEKTGDHSKVMAYRRQQKEKAVQQ